MQKFKLGCIINCRTKEEQEIVLDIFEMFEYRWSAGQKPRGYKGYNAPMNYNINNAEKGEITEGSMTHIGAIEAKDLRNMWISLKRRKSEHEIR